VERVLSATFDARVARSRNRAALFLERGFRGQTFWREHLTYDTRFVARAPWPESACGHFYAVAEGTTTLAGGAPHVGRIAYLLADHEVDHVDPATATTMRVAGPLVRALQIRLPPAALGRPVGLAHGPVELDDDAWAAIGTLIDGLAPAAAREDVDPVAVAEVLRALARHGVITQALADAGVVEEPPLDRARWAAARRCYADFEAATLLRRIAMAMQLSRRQVLREGAELAARFDLVGNGLRDASNLMRLRGAAILLSAPDATATEVARRLGYRSLTALGTAFRNAGLPPPSDVRAGLLAG
jgi:AraC-like DNA-binding protein